jgi:hypothetical protein
MVDKIRRKKLAEHLRHLAAGVITNDDFETRVMKDVSYGRLPEQYYKAKQAKEDDAIMVPLLSLSWGLYSDNVRHTLRGKHQLNKEDSTIIARCILFLNSELEYEWTDFNGQLSTLNLLLMLLTLGFYKKPRQQKELEFIEWQKQGDYNIWPFFNQEDYNTALKTQPYLNAASAA